MKMYLLLKMGIFQCPVGFQVCTGIWAIFRILTGYIYPLGSLTARPGTYPQWKGWSSKYYFSGAMSKFGGVHSQKLTNIALEKWWQRERILSFFGAFEAFSKGPAGRSGYF